MKAGRYSYLIAGWFALYAWLLGAFAVHLLPDSVSPQRAAAMNLVTYVTPIVIFGMSAVGLAAARWWRLTYLAGLMASLPPIYQLWVYLIAPLVSPDTTVSWLGALTYGFLLTMIPIRARDECRAARTPVLRVADFLPDPEGPP